jgi:membrane protease YdiL (CAAX protease family)
MYVSVCVLNPLNEELIYRGVLIFAFGNLIGDFTIVIPAAFLLNLVVHLYQGVGTLLFHALFFLTAVAILFSPLGLLGAVSFHFAGDLIPIATFPVQLRRWVALRQGRRA